uniref:Sulfhydryl oxidase n=1 Tax=Glossina pallidipes TaxID=7398 RepID=A0A1A9ZG99_GLOPL
MTVFVVSVPCFLFVLTQAALLPPSTHQALIKHESPAELGLYNNSDKVKILTNNNFNQEVLHRNHSILVEFYNSYCGHCKRFAPLYKDLAGILFGWRDILPVSAIDCAAEENNGICRQYEIMGYPSLRYFGPGFTPSPGNYGKPINTLELKDVVISLARFIVAENRTANMIDWPDFQPLPENIQTANELFEGLNSLCQYVILIYEAENSTLAVEVILHLNRWPDIKVRRVVDLDSAAKYRIDGLQFKIATVSRSGNIVPHSTLENSAESYVDTIKSFLTKQHITEKPYIEPNISSTVSNLENSENNLKNIVNEVKRNKHLIYQADLEMAIYYILYNEIPKSSNIDGEKLLALQRFLSALNRYNPLGPNGQKIISNVYAFVMQNQRELSGQEFERKLKYMTEINRPIFSSNAYVGCIATKPNSRGYTCSLWQLFHYMTVQAANLDKSQDPLEILQAMHGYVKYYFGCTECSEHFQNMAANRKIWNTSTKDEAILWLWAAHNEVNQRLAGDVTEDPNFPKVQFPTNSSCPLCHDEGNTKSTETYPDKKWNKMKVLQFLKNIYNPEYISRFGVTNESLLQPLLEKLRRKRMIGNVFSDVDMRMGMLLYGFCIVMLMVAFKLFGLKGGYRKKPYGHDLLGKV